MQLLRFFQCLLVVIVAKKYFSLTIVKIKLLKKPADSIGVPTEYDIVITTDTCNLLIPTGLACIPCIINKYSMPMSSVD